MPGITEAPLKFTVVKIHVAAKRQKLAEVKFPQLFALLRFEESKLKLHEELILKEPSLFESMLTLGV